jgi:hypothetical protein
LSCNGNKNETQQSLVHGEDSLAAERGFRAADMGIMRGSARLANRKQAESLEIGRTLESWRDKEKNCG